MSEVTTIPCNLEVKKRLSVLVVKKYGKIRGVLGDEITKAIEERCEKLEQELTE